MVLLEMMLNPAVEGTLRGIAARRRSPSRRALHINREETLLS